MLCLTTCNLVILPKYLAFLPEPLRTYLSIWPKQLSSYLFIFFRSTLNIFVQPKRDGSLTSNIIKIGNISNVCWKSSCPWRIHVCPNVYSLFYVENVFKCSSATEISSEVYSWRKQWLLNNIQGCPLLIWDDFEYPKMRAKNRVCAKI